MNNIKAKYQFLFIIEILLPLTYILIIFLGYEKFTIWSQVATLMFPENADTRWNLIYTLFQSHHPHALRVFLMYPIFLFSDIFNIDVTFLYEIVIVLLLYFTYRLLKYLVQKNTVYYYPILILLFFFGLSLFMHGRIIFALFGNSLILYTLYKKEYEKISNLKFIFFILIALWFCSVSSGTFTVALGTIILFYLLNTFTLLPYVKKNYIYIYVSLLFLLLLLSPIIMQFIQKNLDFYDGSFIHMLDHGVGRYVLQYGIFLIPIVIMSPFFIILFHRFIKDNTQVILPLSMVLSAVGIGLFGISSLVSGLPAFILLIYIIISNKTVKNRR